MPQYLLKRFVAEAHLIDQSRCLRQKQVRAEAAKPKALLVDSIIFHVGQFVPLVDEPEEHAQRLVQMRSTLRLWRRKFDQSQVPQAVEAIAALILRRTGRKNAELGRRLGVQ